MAACRFTLVLALLVAIMAPATLAECPSNDDVAVLYPYDEEQMTFTCAMQWPGHGDPSYLNSCVNCEETEDGVGAGYYNYDGEDFWGDSESCGGPCWYHVGAYMVKPGCTITFWRDYGYEGESWEKVAPAGGLLQPDNREGREFGNDYECADYGFGSWKCRCEQKMIDCVPEDDYFTILYCDNTDGVADVTCTFSVTVGTIWSQSTSDSFAVDASVEYTISAGFFGLFSTELGLSANTGYNWEQVTETTTGEATTITVEATAPAGYVLTIEQAVGSCGGEEPRTEMFKTSNYRNGDLVSEKLEMVDVHRDSEHWTVPK